MMTKSYTIQRCLAVVPLFRLLMLVPPVLLLLAVMAGCTTRQRVQTDEFRVVQTQRTTMCLGLFPVYERDTQVKANSIK
jgi:hypothetical protein